MVLPNSTTESAISPDGILPEKDAPQYPYITFINNLIANYLNPCYFYIFGYLS